MRDTFYCLQHSWFLPLLTEYLLWLVGRFPVLCFPPSLPCFSLAISVAEWHISSQWNPSQSWLRGSGKDEPLIWASIALWEKVMATHSSTLAWRIPWMEEPVGYSPWGPKESDTTERLHFHFSLSCIGKGNGNPVQCSCLENPKDGGAWWASVYGVSQSQTQLKRLSSSNSNQSINFYNYSYQNII